jgi:hypothetical protein
LKRNWQNKERLPSRIAAPQAGADAAAMIGDLMAAEDVAEKVRRILVLRQTR